MHTTLNVSVILSQCMHAARPCAGASGSLALAHAGVAWLLSRSCSSELMKRQRPCWQQSDEAACEVLACSCKPLLSRMRDPPAAVHAMQILSWGGWASSLAVDSDTCMDVCVYSCCPVVWSSQSSCVCCCCCPVVERKAQEKLQKQKDKAERQKQRQQQAAAAAVAAVPGPVGPVKKVKVKALRLKNGMKVRVSMLRYTYNMDCCMYSFGHAGCRV